MNHQPCTTRTAPTSSRTLALTLILATGTLGACTPSTPNDSFGQHLSVNPFTHTTPTTPQHEHTASQKNTENSAYTRETTTKLRAAHGQLNILVSPQAALPQELITHFTELTGVTVDVETFNPENASVPVDLFIGFDPTSLNAAQHAKLLAQTALHDTHALSLIEAIPSAIDYARDDVCLLADTQWYALNSKTPPASLSALIETGEVTSIVQSPEHASSTTLFRAHVNATASPKATEWLRNLDAQSPAPQSWGEAATAHTVRLYTETGTSYTPGRPQWAGRHTGPQSATNTEKPVTPARPLRVAPLSLIGRAVTNTASQSYLDVIPGSCAQRTLYAASSAYMNNPDAAEAFVQYLTSSEAQRTLARTGAALPLDPKNAAGTLFQHIKSE